jgi:flagellar hook assembly protein FlgD
MLNTTTFNFSLKERSHVTLTIYNIKGQLVEIILNEELDHSSSYYVEWDGSVNGRKLANGIYFYKLKTDKETFLNKMILMR